MAEYCGHAYLPGMSADSVKAAVKADPAHFTPSKMVSPCDQMCSSGQMRPNAVQRGQIRQDPPAPPLNLTAPGGRPPQGGGGVVYPREFVTQSNGA
eukprot:1195765-Prorocentrum_minimum.AAC.2